MKAFNFKKQNTRSYGSLIEKIEILRNKLRWTPFTDEHEKQIFLSHCDVLRSDIFQLSHKERLDNVEVFVDENKNLTNQQRKQALFDRSFVFEGVFGANPRLLAALEIAEKAAPTNLPVLIDGESGTGKELMAKVLHTNSQRQINPFVSVNCGAIPESLIESELFGHKKGAFTGASSDRKGKFESARGGTIFLDEIGELPLSGQVKLLRVLQSNEIQRVGSDECMHIDTRVVAATNRDLFAMCQQGSFREDLYYRLSVIQVSLPALRERRDEIALLCEYFCDEAAEELSRSPIRMSPRLNTFLKEYTYPGNIRELRNIIYRLSCLAPAMADIEHLPENIRPIRTGLEFLKKANLWDIPLCDIKKMASDEAEKQFLQEGLSAVEGNVSELAKKTSMNRSHLQTLLKKHGIRSKAFRANQSSQDVFTLPELV